MAENKPFRSTMAKLKTGEKIVFPIEHTPSVRVMACDLGLVLGRKYKTKTNREARTITVLRVS